MTDPSFIPEGDRDLLAVFSDERQAQAARTTLIDAGVPEGKIHLGRDDDTVTALRAEMHAEMTDSKVVSSIGVGLPKEAAQGLLMGGVAGVVLGLVAAFPLALIDFGSTYWVRWAIWAAVGVALGLTVALVAGPSATAPRPGQASPAVAGAVLRVDRNTPDVRRLLADLDPIRIDEVAHDNQPIATVTTDGPTGAVDSATERAKDAAANVQGDDFNPQR